MATLTITPKTANSDDLIFSDTNTSNRVTFKIENPVGTPVSQQNVSGTLMAGANPAGTVQALKHSDTNGFVQLTAVPTQTGKLTLTLNAGGASGTTQVTATLFQPVSVALQPATLSEPGSITATANIVDAGGTRVSNVPLYWHDISTPPSFPSDASHETDGTIALCQYTSDALTAGQIQKLDGKAIPLQLVIGPDHANGLLVPTPVPTSPPLLPPSVMGATETPPVIDDNLIQACSTEGLPFEIPQILNAVANDFVMLFASTVNPPTVQGATVLGEYILKADDVGLPFMMFVATDTITSFTRNGPLYIFYTAQRALLHNVTQSETLEVLLDIDQSTSPDGQPDPGLNKPLVSPSVYSVDDYNSGTTIKVTIPFQGTYLPSAGDQITAVIYLLGYTLVNFNAVDKLTSPPSPQLPYTLAGTDFDAQGKYIPVTLEFPAAQLAGIDGSNGQVYFLVLPAEGGATKRSPSRNIIVDTVPAYSGSYVNMMVR